jgi:hypothetical protein
MNFSREQLVGYWSGAAAANTLLTPKHDPSGLLSTFQGFKSVLTPQLAANLEGFVGSGNYSIGHFQNVAYPNTPDYFVIESKTKDFAVPGSGVYGASGLVLWPCDRLVIVSGANQGWHIYAELASNIRLAQSNGALIFTQAL